MKIHRFCGKEKLPGGQRLWEKMAKSVSFDGNLNVFGYGTGGVPGREQCRAYITQGSAFGATLGDWTPNRIRVWLPCSCAAVEFDPDFELAADHDLPLVVYAHELGHHVQHVRSKGYLDDALEEAVASRYGRILLKKFLP